MSRSLPLALLLLFVISCGRQAPVSRDEGLEFERLVLKEAVPFDADTVNMHADGAVDLDRIRPYADFLVEKGHCSGVFICGTSGESMSLTIEERKAIAQKWVEAAGGRLKVIVHVGGTSRPYCVELASHAQQIGADAIAAMAPVFFKSSCVSDLVEFLVPIAGAAPSLPFYYYNMPSMTGVNLPADEILHEGAKLIPTLSGVKFTHNDLMEMQKCIRADNASFEVLNGFDEILLAGLALGCKAAVGSTYNYMASIYDAVFKAFESGDIATARDMQWKAVEIVEVLVKHGGGIRGGKLFMKLAGFDCGPCRLPIAPVSREEEDEARARLEKTSFFDAVIS